MIKKSKWPVAALVWQECTLKRCEPDIRDILNIKEATEKSRYITYSVFARKLPLYFSLAQDLGFQRLVRHTLSDNHE
jgi:hypothetical protein